MADRIRHWSVVANWAVELHLTQGLKLRPIPKHNSRRYHQTSQFIAIQGCKIIESVGAALTELFPKRTHASTLQGFVLKVWGLIFAHNCNRLASILSSGATARRIWYKCARIRNFGYGLLNSIGIQLLMRRYLEGLNSKIKHQNREAKGKAPG